MDAFGILMVGIGAYLLYAAVKDEHPWTQFQSALGYNQPDVAGQLAAANPASAQAIANNGVVTPQADGTVIANGYSY